VTRPEDLDARGRRLRAALAAVLMRDNAPELRLMREWLNNWSGIGLIIAGMATSPRRRSIVVVAQGEIAEFHVTGPPPGDGSGSASPIREDHTGRGRADRVILTVCRPAQ
jgi:hypothetical protein